MQSALNATDEDQPPEVGVDDDADLQFSAPAFSYVNPKAKLTRVQYGLGMFCAEPILKDEVIIGWSGKVVHLTDVLAMDPSERLYILQIDEELFQVPFWSGYNEPADFINHSCDPNAGFGNSPVSLVAMRDIAPGEEIRFDYSMSECIEDLPGNADWDCLCQSKNCRGMFRGSDWKLPQLWEKYGDYFSPYLRRKIAAIKKTVITEREVGGELVAVHESHCSHHEAELTTAPALPQQ